MNEVFDLAARLGDALKADERLVRLENAKKAYDEEPSLQKAMVEYDVQQKALQTEVGRPEQDTLLIDAIQKRIETLYHEIVDHPVYRELNEAQSAVNILMNEVNATITFHITGEKPSSCTHDCSTCGGGCH